MNEENIKLVINALEKVVPERFDIQIEYACQATPDRLKAEGHACGTTACAAGFAALDEKCNEAGLKPIIGHHGYLNGFTYDNSHGKEAIAKFLGLDGRTSDLLFAYDDTVNLYGKPHHKVTQYDVIYQLEYLRLTGELHIGHHA